MNEPSWFVADSNIILSSALFPSSVPAQAFSAAWARHQLVISAALLSELRALFDRPKFDKYLSAGDRLRVLSALADAAQLITKLEPVHGCRDPEDDKILSLAVSASASFILTGDSDLLVLHPFRSIPIYTPRQYLERATQPTHSR